MSIQSEIDKSLSKDGKFLRTITVNGESGSANVPSNCYVTFQDCSIGSLTVAPHCSIVIGQSSIGTINMTGGTLTMDNCSIAGEVMVSGTRVTQSLCSIQAKTTIANGGSLDGYSNTRNGGGSAGVLAVGNSRAVLSTDVFSGFDTAVELMDGAFGSYRQCKLIGVKNGINAQDKSQAEVFGGEVQGQENVGAKAINSKILLAAITDSSIQGGVVGIRAEDGAEVRVTNCIRIKGAEFGIIAEGEGTTVDVLKFEFIKGEGNAAIKIENGAKVSCRKGDEVTSPASDAVYMKSGTFLARSLKSISSRAANAFKTDQNSVINIFDIAIEIRGYGANGISAGTGDSYEITNCPLLKGDAGHGITATDGCKFVLRSIEMIQGLTGHGVSVANNNLFDFKNVKNVLGTNGHGVNAGNLLQLTASHVENIKGVNGHGMKLGNQCDVRCSKVDTTYGVNGHGIICGEKSTIYYADFKSIKGEVLSAIEAPSSQVIVTEGKTIEGLDGGIMVDGKGGRIEASHLEEIRGHEGSAFRITKGSVYAHDIEIVSAGASGINCTSSIVEIHSITKFSGADFGIKALSSTKCVMSTVKTFSGGIGVQADASEVVLSAIEQASGDAEFVKAVNSSRISVTSAGITGDIGVEGGSDISINTCDVLGDVMIDEGVASLTRVKLTGLLSVVKGSVNSIILDVSANIVLEKSGAILVNTSSLGMTAVDSGIVTANSSLGDVTIANSGHIHAKGAVDMAGTGSAILAEAGTFELPIAGMQGVAGDLNIRGVTITSSTV